MPSHCCVPKCRGNYDGGEKLSVFRFPNDQELRRRWLQAIRRDYLVPTNSSRVCEAHFLLHDILRKTSCFVESTGEYLEAPLKHPRLTADAVPSVFGVKVEANKTSHREAPDVKKLKLENAMLYQAIQESITMEEEHREAIGISNSQELWEKLKNINLGSWLATKRDQNIYFVYFNPNYSGVQCSVLVSHGLDVKVYFGDSEINSLDGCKSYINTISSLEMLEHILEKTELYFLERSKDKSVKDTINLIIIMLTSLISKISEKKGTIQFFCEQIKLIGASNSHGFRFSLETTLFCGLFYSISPHAYKFFRNKGQLFLPCYSTIKKLCSKLPTDPRLEQHDSGFLHFVRSKFHLLKPEDKTVVLMMDEIHLKSYFDYKGGNIVGHAYNNSESATSAHVFMLNSLLSDYKEVVHILPVKTLNANELFGFIKKIILELEKIGFEVLAVVSDNNAINKKAMSYFSSPPTISNLYNHPVDSSRPLFFIIDPVHILKNIRNNWINKPDQNMVYPDFDTPDFKVASFGALKQMHLNEKNQLLKYGYTLSLKALYPTSMERQNVKLALQVFNSNIVIALRELGPIHNFEYFSETAQYINYICTWWDIINVKTPLKGQRLKNTFMEPITQNSNHIFKYLNAFLSWLNKWREYQGNGKLTKETEHALIQTTDGLLKMAEYCLHKKGFKYFLCGKVQTDLLEERFGKYRLQAGAQYHVSVRQVFETESKLRMQNTMPIILKSKLYGNINITLDSILSNFDYEDHSQDHSLSSESKLDTLNISNDLKNGCILEEDDIEEIDEHFWPVITYIAGYAAYSILKKYQCEYCKVFLTDSQSGQNIKSTLITATDRGGLCYPHQDVVTCCAYNYLVILKLIEQEKEFLKYSNQRQLAVLLSYSQIINLNLDIFIGFNCRHHSLEETIKTMLNRITNILLKNYCKKHNDIIKPKTMPQVKRLKPSLNH